MTHGFRPLRIPKRNPDTQTQTMTQTVRAEGNLPLIFRMYHAHLIPSPELYAPSSTDLEALA